MSLLKVIAQRHRTVPAKLDWNPASGAFASTIGPTPVFSRASAATMIDVTGKVVWGPENLALQSGNMASASWQIPAGASTIAAAPGGITDSKGGVPWKMTAAAGSAIHGLQQPVSGGASVYTASLEVQYGNNPWIALGFYDGGYKVCYFNILSGVIGVTGGAGVTGAIVDLGGGRYRISATLTTAANPYIAFFLATGDGGNLTWNALGTEFFYATFAQIEHGSVVRTYLTTTTAPVYGPRITYDPISHQCLGYLAEEQRTNSLLQSQDFNTSPWTTFFSNPPTPNVIISPDGLMNGDKIIEDLSSNGHGIYQPLLGLTGDRTFSVYCKAGERSIVSVGWSATDCGIWVDLNTGTFITNFLAAPTSYSIKNAGNGWWKISVTHPSAQSPFVTMAKTVPPAGTGRFGYPGDGVSGLYLWGAQCEVGSFPTSYIPTTTAAVTRSADLCSISGTDFTGFYNQTEGTIVAGYRYLGHTGYTPVLVFSDNAGFGTNHSRAVFNQPGPDLLIDVFSGGASQASWIGANGGVVNNQNKVALAIKANDANFALNGIAGVSDTVFAVPVNQTWLTFNDYAGAAAIGASTIARIQYFPVRLPNEKLIELTTTPVAAPPTADSTLTTSDSTLITADATP